MAKCLDTQCHQIFQTLHSPIVSAWVNLWLPQLKLSDDYLANFKWVKLAGHLDMADRSVVT